MLRRLSDRARVEGMRALHTAIDRVRGYGGHAPVGDRYLVRASPSDHRDTNETIWSRRTETEHVGALQAAEPTADDESILMHLTEHDVEQTKALNRIADTIERLSAQLDAYHHERGERLDPIEFLLREVVIGAVPPSTARPVVLGGVIDPDAIDRTGPEIANFAGGHPLEVETAVEVRSRFQDRWISGFAIAEIVEGPGYCRYRLSRRSDGIPLPILFDAYDVRATTSRFDPQPATD